MRRLIAPLLLAFVLAGCIPAPPAWDPGPPWDAQIDTIVRHTDGFLICIRRHESDRNDANHNGLHDAGYQAANPRSQARGAYQFLPGTWDSQARAIGRADLVGRWADAWIIDQDLVAWTLSQGTHSPWAGSGCG